MERSMNPACTIASSLPVKSPRSITPDDNVEWLIHFNGRSAFGSVHPVKFPKYFTGVRPLK
jgi:hypothetical protein